MKRLCPQTHEGFTLLEVLIVMVLIAIFVVLAVVQHSTSDATLVAQTQVLKSHIRHAQMRSMNSDAPWGIYYNSTNNYYALFYDGDPLNNIVPLPGETRDRVDMGVMGIAISSAAGSGTPSAQPFQVEFDSWGMPHHSLGAGTETLALELTRSGQAPQQVIITRNTGFIP